MTKTVCGLLLIAMAFWSSPLRAETLCVLVKRGERPVPNERVTVGFVSRNTDNEGRACFENVSAGRHQILVGSGRDIHTCYGSTSESETECQLD